MATGLLVVGFLILICGAQCIFSRTTRGSAVKYDLVERIKP